MKKILLLAIVTISMISCSKSDSSESSTDKIVGKWVVTSMTSQVGTSGTPINSIQPCATLGNTVFTATTATTGTATDTSYEESPTTSDCVLMPVDYATWSNNGSNVYTITQDGSTNVLNITYSNSDRTMLAVVYAGNYIIKTTLAKQ